MPYSDNSLLCRFSLLTFMPGLVLWAGLLFPTHLQQGYRINVTLADGTVRSLELADLLGPETGDLSGFVAAMLDDSDVYQRESSRQTFIDALRQALPEADIAWIDLWKWSLRRPNPPLERSLEWSIPGAYYLITQPQEDMIWLEFGDSLGLLDHRLLNDTSQIAACDTLFVHTGWRALKPPVDDYQITVVLVGLDGMGIVQDDGPLAVSRSSDWQAGEEHLDRRSLTLPCDLDPGIYRVKVGIYDLETVQNLPLRYPEGPFFDTLAILDEIRIAGADS